MANDNNSVNDVQNTTGGNSGNNQESPKPNLDIVKPPEFVYIQNSDQRPINTTIKGEKK